MKIFYSLLFILPLTTLSGQEISADANTLLLLHFNESTTGDQGEVPLTADNITYAAGIHGEAVELSAGSTLSYASTDNIQVSEGTIEFWINPSWSAPDPTHRAFFGLGNDLLLVKDGIDNFRFILRSDDSEAYQAYNLGSWQSGEWHHLAVSWEIPGRMKTYVDGMQVIDHSSAAQDLITNVPDAIYVGSQFGFFTAEISVDELHISNVARTEREISAHYLAGLSLQSIEIHNDWYPAGPITSAELMESWWRYPIVMGDTGSGLVTLPSAGLNWSSNDEGIARVDSTGKLIGVAAGQTTVSCQLGALSASLTVTVTAPVLPPEYETIDPYLSTPDECAVTEIPVVILRYLPTADGVNLDVRHAPDFWTLNPITLDQAKQRIDAFDLRVKFNGEEGSRFRGYQSPGAVPYLGYRVVEYITVYEPMPRGRVIAEVGGYPISMTDFHSVFDRFDLEHYINDLGVKEVWFWNNGFDPNYPSYDPAIHDVNYFRTGWESNMSAVNGIDISNSDRFNGDLPVYDHSYIVYEQNLRRTQAEAVHNRGHQLEAMFSYINFLQDGNNDLFWKKFVGQDESSAFITGRCGWTHMPPNTTADYDYLNETLADSDIEDWNPDGTGTTQSVNVDTWGTLSYDWPGVADFPQKTESQWYLYWMQNMPGYGNEIPYGANYMTNWWQFVSHWDAALAAGLGLYGNTPSPGEPDLCCLDELQLSEITIPPGTYQASGIVSASGTVDDTGEVTFKSGEKIVLEADFTVPPGAQFSALIEDCAPPPLLRTADSPRISQVPNYQYQPHLRRPRLAPEIPEVRTGSRDIRIYPNPTTGQLNITAPSFPAGWIQIKITDPRGQPVQEISWHSNAENSMLQRSIDLGDLPVGMYFIVFRLPHDQFVRRVLLQN
ncbi:LamG-like jellyroll fold domain-containing protein [Flavilitoribacter nigricans]|uniref:Secretion system C-terminal sorting domain-containing protein n=1 Tax=Flavilitoribacter nigricans (strain ATCC 23147 / DSM 23189 / NBRC 102662 / NCIMB 1420 / SS-2) TaxID=1122177 RepID=A0A2D0NA00_FLAN2|nr:LamG-like jellyroll fold domain-containing protein [Flavilitoribacter nigricans]PHN05307.1 hypothetical protein CRP01_17475 [Flavilitoribacter nigricans DSM 23189 = NBRC 102662]